jgi:hypothetical protein
MYRPQLAFDREEADAYAMANMTNVRDGGAVSLLAFSNNSEMSRHEKMRGDVSSLIN